MNLLNKKVIKYVPLIKDGVISIKKENAKVTKEKKISHLGNITIRYNKTNINMTHREFIISLWDTTEEKALTNLYRSYNDGLKEIDGCGVDYWQTVAIIETIKNKLKNIRNKK